MFASWSSSLVAFRRASFCCTNFSSNSVRSIVTLSSSFFITSAIEIASVGIGTASSYSCIGTSSDRGAGGRSGLASTSALIRRKQ
ncbi:hypothetical protein EMPS_07862 [Entomortierella parvispora]|uniref:Uncharacterized protein n=1 Tax=Entomortierella parvispora TaxID=205924 RepID=A0A9P3LYR9_9FUNG|nr:hypothetical protein EMPS_07862 [Entomortierella parvispora]